MSRSSHPCRSHPRGRRALAAATVLMVVALAGCGSSTSHRLRYLDPEFSNLTVKRNLTYGQAAGRNGQAQALTLDLYQPAGDTATRRPAIVWVHGGSFSGGDKSSGPSSKLASDFASLGYVTVSIDYRLLTESPCVIRNEVLTSSCENDAMAARDDAQAAVRWLRANASRYRIDTTRIGIGGDSAGGVVASLVGLNAPAPTDTPDPGQSSSVRAFMSLSGGLPDGRLGDVAVSSASASGLLFSGTADPTVPYQWSTQTTASLQHSGVPAILVSFAGAGHDPYGQFQSQIDQESDYFFYTFMDMVSANGSPSDAAARFDPRMKKLMRESPAYAGAVAALARR